MHELLILIQDVYDPKVGLMIYANLTGKLISEEYEKPYTLFEFSSYEDAVEKLKDFYNSYTTATTVTWDCPKTKILYYHCGLPIISIDGNDYAVAINRAKSLEAATELIEAEIEDYDEALEESWDKDLLDEYQKIGAEAFFKKHGYSFLATYDEEEITFDKLTFEQQSQVLEILPNATQSLLYRL